MAKAPQTWIGNLGSLDLPYAQPVKNRHGRIYWYYRRAGRRVRLPGEPGSPEWMAVYWRERGDDDKRLAPRQGSTRTVARLIQEYFRSPDFLDLEPSTKRTYRSSLNELVDLVGEDPVADLRFRHVNKIIGDMADRPAAANKMLKRMRTLFGLAVRLEWIDRDPSAGVRQFKTGEIHTWTDDEIQQFRDRWKPGTRQRLAFTLQLCTGQRNSDVVAMQWPRDGRIQVTQEKTGARLWLPVPQELEDELDRHERKHLVILATEYGKPRSAAGYGNWMREAIRSANLPARCSPHGLRKAAAAHLADAGCSAHEIMAITGHRTLGEVERYTRAAQQEILARSAQAKRTKNVRLATPRGQTGNPSKSETKSNP